MRGLQSLLILINGNAVVQPFSPLESLMHTALLKRAGGKA